MMPQRAEGLVPSARVVNTQLLQGAVFQPIRRSLDVLPNISPLNIFRKKIVQVIQNSEDTSIINHNFGVSIYADPSGIFTQGD